MAIKEAAHQYINACIIWGEIFRTCDQALSRPPVATRYTHLQPVDMKWSKELDDIFKHYMNAWAALYAAYPVGIPVSVTIEKHHHGQ